MLRLADPTARLARLGRLTTDLAREAMLWREANDPLLYRERRAYLRSIQDAQSGVETARAALAGACRRLQGGEGA